MTIQEAKNFGKSQLSRSPTPALDTEVLLQFITNTDKTHLLLNRDEILTNEQESSFLDAIEKRKTGLPIAYITNHKEFFGYDFYVTPSVLIPKPDTELLVELALNVLEDKSRSSPDSIFNVCDMCAGSGCVGISILKTLARKKTEKNLPKFVLSDISENALDIAKKNSSRLLDKNLLRDKIHFVRSNLFENISQNFDLIVTNPPYVPHSECIELLKDGRSEPILALDGDVSEIGENSGTNDGLALIRRLIPQCYEHLNRGGILIMESGEYNTEEAEKKFKDSGFRYTRIELDMNEMLRDVIGIK